MKQFDTVQFDGTEQGAELRRKVQLAELEQEIRDTERGFLAARKECGAILTEMRIVVNAYAGKLAQATQESLRNLSLCELTDLESDLIREAITMATFDARLSQIKLHQSELMA